MGKSPEPDLESVAAAVAEWRRSARNLALKTFLKHKFREASPDVVATLLQELINQRKDK